ncbi:ABC transporter family protein (macronuclear) [Tetrahymena thermophila SB210]|uniref:ABC transporter family protein n=1 Tax=Tetrahymena thermophila (strain SB210) TaxID=312017 RepID=Q236X0_TETTS|nr:ABC transporter family protein [Tetrahymena thermophila SB210]EAR92380.2 ABC transporter family protein [Tetrahymena thermophila SB210]|eukprot:XP_001012625.2 ABC transporter family protein [Tetrahymena thermophila SB210]
MSQNKNNKVPFFSLYRLASKQDIIFIFIGTISAVGNGVMQPLFGQLFGEMAQKFTPENTPDQVFEGSAVLAGYFILVGVLSFFLSCSMLYCWINVGEKQAINIRYSYFKSMIQQDISYFDSINSNELSSKVALDCFKIQQAIGEKLCMYIYTLSMLAGSLIISFIRGWQIALVSCIIIPIVWYTCKFLTWVSSGVVKKTSQEYQQAGGVAEQALSSIRTIKSLNGEQFEADKFSSLITKAYKVSIKYSIFTGIAYGIQNMMLFFDFSLTFWVGSIFIEKGITNQNMQRDYLFSDIIVVFLSIVLTSFRLGGATDSVNYFQEAQVSGFEVFSIIEKKPVIQQNESAIKFTDQVQDGKIQFENVRFAYPSRNGIEVFKGLNFQLQAKKKTAFVGKSGCGKSTIIQLIERFYDPTEGSIYIDGVNIKDMQLNSLRLAIGYVSQEPILFATTIRENLRYSKPDATEEEMIEALKKANVWSFIENQEHKLDTFVGQNGTQLSGGQKQRICIARAILKKPKILLLDEATSALDTKNEALIQLTLDEVTQGITTVIIAHRLSTIQSADEIIVIDDGQIMERGSHQELMEKNGFYFEFVKKQQKTEQNNENNNTLLETDRKLNQAEEFINIDLNKQTSLLFTNNILVQNLNGTSYKDLPTTQRQMSSNQDANLISQNLITNLYTETDTQQLNYQTSQNENKLDRIPQLNIEVPKQYSFFQMVKKLLTYDKKQTLNAFLGMFFSIGNGIAYPFCGWVFGNIASILLNPNVDHFREKADLYSIYFAVIGLVDLVSLTLQYFFQSRISETLTLTLRQNLFKKFLTMPISWFDKPSNNSGALSSSLQIDCKQVNVLVGTTLTFNIANVSSLICAILLGLSADWRTTLVGLFLMPLIVLANILFAVRMNIFSSKMNQSSEDTAQLINESSCHIRTVASLGNPLCFCENFKAILSKNISDINESAFQAGMAIGFTNLALFGVYGIIFICGAAFHRSYDVEIRDILISILCLMFAALGIGKNTEFMGDAGASLVSANKIFQTLDLQDEIQQNKGVFETDLINGELSFENVSFKYPERDAYVLKNVSFKIPAKSKVAFVGPSGSGKTSIIQLIQRFYSNYQGKIFLDGVDIKQYHLKKYRSYLGVVQQEPVLFNGTIQQNMIYNTQNVSEQDLNNASTLSNTQEFVKTFEEGFQKQVGQRGIQISGGQKQRIAIGRVILKQPQIMLLDEATSALDSQNENQVQNSLNKVMQNKTSISVAHRISTIKNSDIIFVLDNGQIVEQGDYNQLMKLKNHFFKLQQNTNNQDQS